MVDVKRRAHNARPYAKTEGDTVGAASSRPKSLPPTGGEGFMLAHRIFCRAHHDEKIKS